MTFIKVSIPKSAGGGAGTPKGKDPNVIIFLMRDVAKTGAVYSGWPTTDTNGVKSTSNLALVDGAEAFAVYITPSTINRFNTSEGDADKMGWLQNFVGEHPGEELPFAEFLQNNLNEDFGIISLECGDSLGTRLIGTPCAPLKLKSEGQDNNEGVMSTLTFASAQRGKFVMMHYRGTLPTLAANYDEGSGSGGGGL
jgi:hypothetical protein